MHAHFYLRYLLAISIVFALFRAPKICDCHNLKKNMAVDVRSCQNKISGADVSNVSLFAVSSMFYSF